MQRRNTCHGNMWNTLNFISIVTLAANSSSLQSLWLCPPIIPTNESPDFSYVITVTKSDINLQNHLSFRKEMKHSSLFPVQELELHISHQFDDHAKAKNDQKFKSNTPRNIRDFVGGKTQGVFSINVLWHFGWVPFRHIFLPWKQSYVSMALTSDTSPSPREINSS